MNENFAKETKATKTIYFVAFLAYFLITGLPDILINYFNEEISFHITIFTELLLSLCVYIFLLNEEPGFKIKIKIKKPIAIKFIKLFLSILLIQIFLYIIRIHQKYIESEKIDDILIFISCFVVPFYEEIFYRGVLFLSLDLFFKGNIKIVYLVTSLFFCLMHTQYYDLVDQIILFIDSIILIQVRRLTKSMFYPILTHSSMNLIIIFMNFMEINL